MTPEKAARNWKLTAAGLTVFVIVLLLLWPKLRQSLGELVFGPVNIGGVDMGDTDYADIFVTVNYPPTTPAQPGGTCGCESHGQEMIDAAMAFFVSGMRDIQERYLAEIMAARPDWAAQYWNNSLGFAMSQSSGALFGARREYGRAF